MAKKKVGELIKDARTAAGLSQARLAEEVEGLSAADIGKAERGEKDLTQAQLKAIAKATGVTQKSLLEAPKGGAAAEKKETASASKTSGTSKTASKTSSTSKTASKTASKTGSASKTSGKTTSKTSSSKTSSKTTAKDSETLTNAEKQLVKLYRAADSDTKKAAISLLKGEKNDIQNLIGSLLQGSTAAQAAAAGSGKGDEEDGGIIGALLGSALEMFNKK